jgi:ABC-2 type transport system permease protein
VLAVRSLDGKRLVSLANLLTYFIPTLGGFILLFATFTTSGYLMNAIIEERANRTMEILITSLTPWQLIGGKTIGLAGVGLTQLLFWTTPLWVLLYLRHSWLSTIAMEALPLDALKLLVISFIPAFLIIAALMTTLGAMVGDQREGQTIASLFFLPVYLPFAFYSQIVEDPNGPLAIGLSIFPVTTPVTLSMRQALGSVPLEQVVMLLAFQTLIALSTIWLAGYVWRLGMLQYGRRLSLREVFGRRRKAGAKL